MDRAFDVVENKLREDFAQSHLESYKSAKKHQEENAELINAVFRGIDKRRNLGAAGLKGVDSSAWKGVISPTAIAGLADLIDRLDDGCVRFSCTAIMPAAYVTLVEIRELVARLIGVEGKKKEELVRIDYTPLTGKEATDQISKLSHPYFDYVITADPPAYSAEGDVLRQDYERVFSIHTERQQILATVERPSSITHAHVYTKSSNSFQIDLARLEPGTFEILDGIPKKNEIPVDNVLQYGERASNLAANHCIIAWQPLARELIRDYGLKPIPNHDFEFTISLYQRLGFPHNRSQSSIAFLFVAVWNYMDKNRDYALNVLRTQPNYVAYAVLGAGLEGEEAGVAKSFRDCAVATLDGNEFYFVAPKPRLGDRFYVTRAHKIKVPKGKTRTILRLLADSPDGCRVSTEEILLRHYRGETAGRKKYIQNTCNEFAKTIRDLIRPFATFDLKKSKLARNEGKEIRTSLETRALLSDSAGNYYFGKLPPNLI